MITLAEIELQTERIRSHGVINDCAFELQRCDAASVSELEILQAELSVTLPDDLFKLLLASNGIVYGYFKGRVPMDVIKISSVAEIIQGKTWLANSLEWPSTAAPVLNVGRATDTERTIALVSNLSDPTFATGAILRNVDEFDTLSFRDALFLADSVSRFIVHSLEFMQPGSGHARYWDADGYALANVGKLKRFGRATDREPAISTLGARFRAARQSDADARRAIPQ